MAFALAGLQSMADDLSLPYLINFFLFASMFLWLVYLLTLLSLLPSLPSFLSVIKL